MNDTYHLSDAHCHFVTKEDLDDRVKLEITSLICNSSIEDIQTLNKYTLPSFIIPTFGIHPWSADKLKFEDYEEYLNDTKIIGEIGMDSVWCDVDLKIQADVFERQLALAKSLNKPVILHTKGQEYTISKLIAKYPNKYLVHWYSCPDYLDEYIKMDCYFSIGPDVIWNEVTQNVAAKVPLKRILSETDGLSAVKWAMEEAPATIAKDLQNLEITSEASLSRVIDKIAEIRKLDKKDVIEITYQNLVKGFLK